jgi:signal transduction histidine kinase
MAQSLTDIVSTLRAGGDRLDAMLDHLAERGAALMPAESPKLAVRMPAIWPDERMTLAARRAVQSILLEAMHNAARHSSASRVELGADWQGRAWRVWVDDDGVGVAGGPATRPGGGSGLDGMKTRAEAIGAELRVGAGATGKGTRVEVVFDPRRDEPR